MTYVKDYLTNGFLFFLSSVYTYKVNGKLSPVASKKKSATIFSHICPSSPILISETRKTPHIYEERETISVEEVYQVSCINILCM